jgi:alpha-mannosidase
VRTRCLFILSVIFSLQNGFCQTQHTDDWNKGKGTGDTTDFDYRAEPYYKFRHDGKPGRVVTLFLSQKTNKPQTVTVICEGKKEVSLVSSDTIAKQLTILLPENIGLRTASTAEVIVRANGQDFTKKVWIPVKRQWTVFIYPHSHVDIGYTGLQEDVEKLHVRNIDVGIDLAKKTKDYPEGARFVWNPEATWVVTAYLKKATDEQKRNLIEAVKKGWIQIDAGHSNINTTTCSDEELMHFFQNSNEIEKMTTIPVTTMVQVDVPGAAWGLVQAAAQNGVTGFISFPNNYDLRKIREHKPFYWRGPDGKSKILFLQGFQYGIGYTVKGSKYGLATLQRYSDEYDRVSTGHPLQNFIDAFIFNETTKLERADSPYDLFVMTWSMADNCVIDADLPEAVKQWNAMYAYPKLVIAGSKQILSAWEKKYSNIIPEYSGDFTEFWTDGLGSDAAHVGMGRRAKENLVQAETLWTLLHPNSFPKEKINATWENILLSTEHTWGYQNPGEPLAKLIEKRKAAFFSDAEQQSKDLLDALGDSSMVTEQFAVVNTLSWSRGGMVALSPGQSRKGNRVIEMSSGKEVPSQRLSNGYLLFHASTIPALASRLYKVVEGAYTKNTSLLVSDMTLENNALSVTMDPVSGDISHVTDKQSGYEYVARGKRLNSYEYMAGVYNGRIAVSPPTGEDSVIITIKERGPLLVSLLVRSKAEGINWMEKEVRLYANERFIQIRNTFDKIRNRKKEGIHFGFAFDLPGAVSRMDAPWSVITPETTQLEGANRNWMTFQRWIDISNSKRGVTWTAIESPLVEWEELSGTILDGARQYWLWKKHLSPSSTLYSWPVNNHWNTNFPLEQSGVIGQQYAILFHGAYDAVIANQFGMEQHRSLLAIPAAKNLIKNSFVGISNPRVMISALRKTADGKAVLLRIRSVSNKTEKVKLTWPVTKPQKIEVCTAAEIPLKMAAEELTIRPHGTECLYLTF